MDVKTLTFYELEQKLRYAEDENKRLKDRIAYLEKSLAMLAIDPDGEIDPDIINVADGEVLSDAND